MPLKVLFWSCFSVSGSKWIDARAEVYYKPTLVCNCIRPTTLLHILLISYRFVFFYYTDKLALFPRLSLNFWAQVILLLHPLRKNVFLTFGQGELFLSFSVLSSSSFPSGLWLWCLFLVKVLLVSLQHLIWQYYKGKDIFKLLHIICSFL